MCLKILRKILNFKGVITMLLTIILDNGKNVCTFVESEKMIPQTIEWFKKCNSRAKNPAKVVGFTVEK